MNRLTIDFGALLDTIPHLPVTITLLTLAVVYALTTVIVMHFGRK